MSSGGDKTLFYWDVSTGQTIRRIAAHNGKIPAVSLNEDASVVVSGEHEDEFKALRLIVLRLAHRVIRHECEDMGPQVAFLCSHFSLTFLTTFSQVSKSNTNTIVRGCKRYHTDTSSRPLRNNSWIC